MKSGVPNTLKFKRLKRLLQQPDCMVAGVLEMLWGLAVDQARMGDVGRFTDEEIATAIDWPGDPTELVSALKTSGWLDVNEKCRLLVHDWIHHAPQFVIRWIGRELGVDPKAPRATERIVEAWLSKFGISRPSDYSRISEPDLGEELSSQIEVRDAPCGRGSIPPHPNQTTSTPTNEDPVWAAVEAALFEEGLLRAPEAVATARARDCTPAKVFEVIEHFRSNKPAWGPGALGERISRLRMHQSATELWPEPSKPPAVDPTGSRVQHQTEADRRRRVDAAAKAAEQARVADLERIHGAELDSKSRDWIRDAIRSKDPGAADLLLRSLPSKGPPGPGMLRLELLEILANPEPPP